MFWKFSFFFGCIDITQALKVVILMIAHVDQPDIGLRYSKLIIIIFDSGITKQSDEPLFKRKDSIIMIII